IGAAERGRFEERQRNHGCDDSFFDEREKSERDKSNDQASNYPGVAPTQQSGFEKPIHQSRQTGGCDQRSQPIDSLRRRAARLRNLPQRDSDYRGGERNIDKENPVPRGVLDQPPAQNRTQSSCYGGESRPRPDCFATRLLVKGSTDYRETGRYKRCSSDPLNTTGRDQLRTA